jgi:hypothetical protein
MVATNQASSPPLPPNGTTDEESPASMSKRNGISKKRPLLRKVGFADPDTFRINVLDSLSEEERSNTWYTSTDYAVFGREAKTTVKHIRKGRPFAGLTGRGLEKYFSSQYHEEKKRREMGHYRSILVEQHRQRTEGNPNPKILRAISTVNSKWALHNALELARHDQTEAQQGIPEENETPQAPVQSDSDSALSCEDIISLRKDDEIKPSKVNSDSTRPL